MQKRADCADQSVLIFPGLVLIFEQCMRTTVSLLVALVIVAPVLVAPLLVAPPLVILKYESHYGQVTLRKHSVTCSCQSGSQELDLLKMVALAGAWLLKEPK